MYYEYMKFQTKSDCTPDVGQGSLCNVWLKWTTLAYKANVFTLAFLSFIIFTLFMNIHHLRWWMIHNTYTLIKSRQSRSWRFQNPEHFLHLFDMLKMFNSSLTSLTYFWVISKKGWVAHIEHPNCKPAGHGSHRQLRIIIFGSFSFS